MKRKVMEKVNKKGNLEDVEKDNKVSGTHLNIRFEHILNNQIVEQDEAKSILKTKKTFKRTLTSGSKGPFLTSPKSAMKRMETGIYGERQNIVRDKVYNNCDEVKLDKEALQDYFAYEALNLVDKKFRIKKSKKQEQMNFEFDEDFDLAKPIPGKAEIQIYDRKTTNLIRKTIKFEKNKHKYLNFLTGCRWVLIKDRLYIFGGVDKENNITKVAWIYHIKDNELTSSESAKKVVFYSLGIANQGWPYNSSWFKPQKIANADIIILCKEEGHSCYVDSAEKQTDKKKAKFTYNETTYTYAQLCNLPRGVYTEKGNTLFQAKLEEALNILNQNYASMDKSRKSVILESLTAFK